MQGRGQPGVWRVKCNSCFMMHRIRTSSARCLLAGLHGSDDLCHANCAASSLLQVHAVWIWQVYARCLEIRICHGDASSTFRIVVHFESQSKVRLLSQTPATPINMTDNICQISDESRDSLRHAVQLLNQIALVLYYATRCVRALY